MNLKWMDEMGRKRKEQGMRAIEIDRERERERREREKRERESRV